MLEAFQGARGLGSGVLCRLRLVPKPYALDQERALGCSGACRLGRGPWAQQQLWGGGLLRTRTLQAAPGGPGPCFLPAGLSSQPVAPRCFCSSPPPTVTHPSPLRRPSPSPLPLESHHAAQSLRKGKCGSPPALPQALLKIEAASAEGCPQASGRGSVPRSRHRGEGPSAPWVGWAARL